MLVKAMNFLRRRGIRDRIAPMTPYLDVMLAPTTLAAAVQMRVVREIGIERLHACRGLFESLGVFPLRDHYYEPLFRTKPLRGKLDVPRSLPGIDLDLPAQLERLRALNYQEELKAFPRSGAKPGHYAYDCGNFGPGDAEILYSVIRHTRPRRIVEVGSGFSTLVAHAALERNRREHGSESQHLCIEPFEMAWLESTGVDVIRQRVEEVDPAVFTQLERGDILFIDSSHILRPGGDVLFLYQQVLPRLADGVLVHIHDIFTPYDYPESWLVDRVCFWNEQYLLEAFLCFNPTFRPYLSLHALSRSHFAELSAACPVLAEDQRSRPKSFWLVRG
jgi:predicted O-methyltransferase YrrM